MTSARIVGVAVGNGRFQDELCDALAPLLPIERCRTDRELLALAAQHVLGGAVVGHDLLGLDRHVFPALVATTFRQYCWCSSGTSRAGWQRLL